MRYLSVCDMCLVVFAMHRGMPPLVLNGVCYCDPYPGTDTPDPMLQSIGVNSAKIVFTRWRHQMKTFSALLAICAGNSLVPGEFPTQRPVTRSFDVFYDLRLNKWLSKQSWGWWFQTLSRPLWRQCNVNEMVNFPVETCIQVIVIIMTGDDMTAVVARP